MKDTIVKDVIGQAPKIIAESAKSPLGIIALMTLALSFLGYLFFARSSDGVKVSMFCLMFLGFGLMAYNLVRRPSIPSKGARKKGTVQQPRAIKEDVASKVGIIETVAQGISARKAYHRLAWVVFSGVSLVTALLVVQFLLGRYDLEGGTEVWAWLAPMALPPASVIVAALAFDTAVRTPSAVVSQFAYRVAFWLALAFSIFLLLTILLQPFALIMESRYLSLSTLWLTPLQSVLLISLCVLVMSRVPVTAPITNIKP